MGRTVSSPPAGEPKGGWTLALGLYSGSLASAAAVRLAHHAGVTRLRLFYFRSPFFLGEDLADLHAQRWFPDGNLQTITLKGRFLAVNGRDTEGSSPCAGCRRLLLERGARVLRRIGGGLLVTGGVVGRGGVGVDDLLAMDRALGIDGRVLRPLSARLLPPTQAEVQGLVDRDALLDLTDGDDLPRVLEALGASLGLVAVADRPPCLLTDRGFAARLREVRRDGAVTKNLIQLLQFERFYRLGRVAQMVVAVTGDEQARLQPLFLPSDVRLYVQISGSPLALVRARWADCVPEQREAIVAWAAERMAQAAGLPRSAGWVVRVRCEWEEETRQMRLPSENIKVPALISS